jgi:hypothetical protein
VVVVTAVVVRHQAAVVVVQVVQLVSVLPAVLEYPGLMVGRAGAVQIMERRVQMPVA